MWDINDNEYIDLIKATGIGHKEYEQEKIN
jgi:hypothetical protein